MRRRLEILTAPTDSVALAFARLRPAPRFPFRRVVAEAREIRAAAAQVSIESRHVRAEAALTSAESQLLRRRARRILRSARHVADSQRIPWARTSAA
jgi:hypothetical protein